MDEVKELYAKLIQAWNDRDASGMADLFSKDGIQIGFDGSDIEGRSAIQSHLEPIFREHATPPFIYQITTLKKLGDDAALLHAAAGMIPPGESEINPDLNAHQTMAAVYQEGAWEIALFQNTPAQYHGRPDLKEEMTQAILNAQT